MGRPASTRTGAEPVEAAVKGMSDMQIGLIGLGRMGNNIVRRLTQAGHRCVVFDRDATAIKRLQGPHRRRRRSQGAGRQLEIPRAVWVMVPAGRRPRTPSQSSAHCSKRATSSSTAATASTRMTSAAPRARHPRHRLRRLRHQRRHMGARARLLPDDRVHRQSDSTQSSPPSPWLRRHSLRPDGTAAIPGRRAAICIAAEAAPAIS